MNVCKIFDLSLELDVDRGPIKLLALGSRRSMARDFAVSVDLVSGLIDVLPASIKIIHVVVVDMGTMS